MPIKNIIYANSRVSVLSVKLITLDRFMRMASSVNADDAFRVLLESQFASDTSKDNYKQMIEAEELALYNLIKQLDLGEAITQFLFLPADYLNAKILMKSKYLRLNEFELSQYSIIDTAILKNILTDNYEALPKYMQKACSQIDQEFADGNRNPVLIDSLLDKALNKHLLQVIDKIGNNLLSKYYSLKCDCTNLLTVIRANLFNLSEQALRQMLLKGGTVGRELWVSMLAQPIETIIKSLEKFPELSTMLIKCGVDLTACESYVDQLLKNTVVEFKNDIETCLPVINYYYAKQAEIDNVRIIMVCLRNNVDKQQITSRLREIYV